MFKKDNKSYTDLLGKTNRIVEGTKISGDVTSAADFRLDGELIGNYHSNGKLVIGPHGFVKGEIICKSADIEGKVEGKVVVAELLSVKGKASIKGDVVCGKLSVEPGALFAATCTMKQSVKNLPAVHENPSEEKIA